jgi:hypothetical protein
VGMWACAIMNGLKLVNFLKNWLFNKDIKILIKGTLQYSKVSNKVQWINDYTVVQTHSIYKTPNEP